MLQVNCHIFTLSIYHQKGKFWQSLFAAGQSQAGVSGLLGPESPVPGFPCRVPSCGAVLDSTPEYDRRMPGVSGRPECPALGDRSLRPLALPRQSLRWVAESPATPKFPVPPTGVSGLPRVCKVWCGAGALSGGTSEGVRSFRPAPESPAHLGRSLRP